jgi:hypothetical protein
MEISQDFKEFIQLLNKNNVKYLVVGGYAVAMHGFPRYTGDIDFWIEPEKENAEKLVKVLYEFGFGSLDISINDFTKQNSIVQLGFPPERIDIITSVDGLTFEECWKEKKEVVSDEILIDYISLNHLRINKAASARDKDLLDLKNLPKDLNT